MQDFQVLPLYDEKRNSNDNICTKVDFSTSCMISRMSQNTSNGSPEEVQLGDNVVELKSSRTPSLENSDDVFFDCTDGGNLSPLSPKEFLRHKPGAPTELPNDSSMDCLGGDTCGLCTKLKIPRANSSLSVDGVDNSSDDLYNGSSDGATSPWDAASPPTSPRSPGAGDDVTATSPLSSGTSSPRRRKTSLRSPNSGSAPDTPRRKSVRFADALGLDLETVKHILENESSPDYPQIALGASSQNGNEVTILPRYLSIVFQQPGGQSDFISRVYSQNVCLENVVVSDFTVLGTIKVRNIHYMKTVKVRYSCDGWRTFGDVPASYVRSSCDGPMDRFSFGLSAPRELPVLGAIEFAVCYVAGSAEYWDNNYGHNYRLECNAQAQTLASGAGEDVHRFWTHFL